MTLGAAQFGQVPFGASPAAPGLARAFSATQAQAASLARPAARTFETRYLGVELPMASSLWRLGEASGSLVDSAGARTGTPHGTVNRVAGLVPGDNDGAVSFPTGSGNYIDTGSAYSTLFSGTGSFSLVAVVQPSFLDSGNRRIMSMMTTSARGVMMYASNAFCGFFRGEVGGSDNQYKAIGIPLTSPTHIVCTYDGTTMRVYFNGVQSGTGKASSRSLAVLNPLYIGNDPVDTSLVPWRGTIDEAMVCTYALSQAQITALYTAYSQGQAVTGKANAARTQAAAQSQAVTEQATRSFARTQGQSVSKSMSLSRVFRPTYVPLLKQLTDGSLWSLDETVSTYGDSVGAVNGTVHGTPTRGVAGLLPGGGGDPNDRAMTTILSADYVNFGLNYGFPGRAPFSFVVVHKPAVVDAMYRRIICADSGGSNHGWSLQSMQDELLFYRGDASGGHSGVAGLPLVAGQTYLIVGTYDGTYMTLYVNGVLQIKSDPSYPPHQDHVLSTQSLPAQTSAMCLGYGLWPGGPAPGTYDSFAICQYALSTAQVGALWGAFNQGQSALVTREDSIPVFRATATQDQAIALTAAASCTVSAAGGQSLSVAGQWVGTARFALSQSAVVALQRDVSQTVGVSGGASVSMVGSAATEVTFSLSQGASVRTWAVARTVRTRQAPQSVGMRRALARSFTRPQGASPAASKNIASTRKLTQVAVLVSVRTTARTTFAVASGQVVVLWGIARTMTARQAQTIALARGVTGTFVVAQDQAPIYHPRLKRGRVSVTARRPGLVVTVRPGSNIETSVTSNRITVEVS